MAVLTVDTPHGPAAAHLHPVPDPRGAVVLGHGAGGGVDAPDLVAAVGAGHTAGFTVVLVQQPYRVAGRKAPPRAPTLDASWTAVLEHLRGGELTGLPVVVGGRSSGARVACRTATTVGAAAVLCLAFPLHPPARAGKEPGPSRLQELAEVPVPVLVVQGARDPFGVPPEAPGRTVVTVGSDHSLRSAVPEMRSAVSRWLTGLGPLG